MEVYGKVVKESLDFLLSVLHVGPAAHLMKEHIALDPSTLASLCTYRIVATSHYPSHFIEQIAGHESPLQEISRHDMVNIKYCKQANLPVCTPNITISGRLA